MNNNGFKRDSVFVIAEAGVNHNGSIDTALKLIDVAVDAGADAVKFQTFKADLLVVGDTGKAEYQKKTTDVRETQYEMLKRLEIPFSEHKKLMDYCVKRGIMFLSTAFEEESALFLKSLGIGIFKIPSGEITNYPLLRTIGGFKMPVIMSTGMSNMEEVAEAIEVLNKFGTKDITLLHCNTQYPTPYQDVNLKAMLSLRKKFELPVGYSDHTIGIAVPVAAVALGACVIEKHFTLDKTMEGPDHSASLNPQELKEMVTAIRNVKLAMGDGIKSLTESEKENVTVVRKSIVAKRDIIQGEAFTEDNITTKRPGGGISPMKWTNVIGKHAVRTYKKDEQIEE